MSVINASSGFNPNDRAREGYRLDPRQASDGLRYRRYLYMKPSTPFLNFNGTVAGGITAFPAGNQAAEVDLIVDPKGSGVLEMYNTTAQTLFPVFTDGSGLEIALDQVDNESVEYVPGGNSAVNPYRCLVGTDPSVFIRATVEFDDASFSDQMLIGYRKQEAYAVPTSFLSTGDGTYTDFAGIGFAHAKANPNIVYTATDAANSGSTTTKSTLFSVADNDIVTFEVRVVGAKVVYLINGQRVGDRITRNGEGTAITAQDTATPTPYSFTAGLNIIPFIFIRQDADVGHVYLRELEVGYLRDVGLADNEK